MCAKGAKGFNQACIFKYCIDFTFLLHNLGFFLKENFHSQCSGTWIFCSAVLNLRFVFHPISHTWSASVNKNTNQSDLSDAPHIRPLKQTKSLAALQMNDSKTHPPTFPTDNTFAQNAKSNSKNSAGVSVCKQGSFADV